LMSSFVTLIIPDCRGEQVRVLCSIGAALAGAALNFLRLCVISWFWDFRGLGGIDWSAVLPADA